MKTETAVKKIKLDTSYQGSKRTERFEFRCSNNFNLVVNALIEIYGKEHRHLSKSDLLHKIVKDLANEKKILLVGDDYYI